MVITASTVTTSVGFTTAATTAAVRAGIARIEHSEEFEDQEGNPVAESRLRWPDVEEDEAIPEAWGQDDDGVANELSMEAFMREPASDAAGEAAGEAMRREEDADEASERTEEASTVDTPGDAPERIAEAARESLASLLGSCLDPEAARRTCHLVLGVAARSRPGPRYEGPRQEIAEELATILRSCYGRVIVHVVAAGNASGMVGMSRVDGLLRQDPSALCIVGGIDSLLSQETVGWFERDERLRSDTFGRAHGIAVGEAVGFLALEEQRYVRRSRRPVSVEVAGVGVAVEPAPFGSKEPCRSQGLTQACRDALAAAGCPPDHIGLIVGDVDGEFHRAREWTHADTRCFPQTASGRLLIHPAEAFGTIGAAYGPVLVAIAATALARGWARTEHAMVFCSDDGGDCGATVLRTAKLE
jgi:3-oxoacyl-[acyl-carrier-protein] synthase-1